MTGTIIVNEVVYSINNLNDLTAGDYTTTIMDENGCTTDVTFTVSQPDELIASASVLDVSCFGENDGSAILSISGGTGEYTTEDLSNLSAGEYTTTVTDENGCTTDVTFTVSQPDELIASASVLNVSCFGRKWWFCYLIYKWWNWWIHNWRFKQYICWRIHYYSNWWKRMCYWCFIYYILNLMN